MTPYETIKNMSLEEMANHHALFAIVTLMPFAARYNIEKGISWIDLYEKFFEEQKKLLNGEIENEDS